MFLNSSRGLLRVLLAKSVSTEPKFLSNTNVPLFSNIYSRTFSTTSLCLRRQQNEIVPKDSLNFDQIDEWKQAFKPLAFQDKKKNFYTIIKTYKDEQNTRKGHLEFIYAALKQMESSGVHKDLEAYHDLMDVFPKDKYVASNLYQAEFFHFPYHQDCALTIMQQMEDNGVIPDEDFCKLLVLIFGNRSNVFKKYERMVYWIQKFRYQSPFPLPKILPDQMIEKAKLGILRMIPDPLTKVFIVQTEFIEGSTDKTWIVSGEAPDQKKLIEALHDEDIVFIDGPLRLWLRDSYMAYFMLYSKPNPKPDLSHIDIDDVSDITHPLLGEDLALRAPDRTIHEQDDSTLLGLCMTGTSTHDSINSWIRYLQSSHPKLQRCRFVLNYFPVKKHTELIVATSDTSEKELIDNLIPINT